MMNNEVPLSLLVTTIIKQINSFICLYLCSIPQNTGQVNRYRIALHQPNAV